MMVNQQVKIIPLAARRPPAGIKTPRVFSTRYWEAYVQVGSISSISLPDMSLCAVKSKTMVIS